jgi:tRNA-dihydrouridine synthase B
MRMRIGPYEIGDGALLAPMAGITNPPFRQLCRELGAVATVGELVSCHAVLALEKRPRARAKRQRERTRGLLTRFAGEQPFAVQLCGRDPELMARAAAIVEREGADIVDLNFGCPARKIVKDGRGAGVALMLDPPLLEEVAARVVDAVSVPVTAKIRLGWSRDQLNAPEVARALERSGIRSICVHARTREQVHSGPVDLDALREVCQAVGVPVVGNGGIRNAADAKEMIDRTGCARVAIGQAARGNPWIFTAVRGQPGSPTVEDRIATCRRHLQLHARFAGEQRGAREMRKHACWYLKGFPGAAAFRKRLAGAVDLESFSRLLDEIELS